MQWWMCYCHCYDAIVAVRARIHCYRATESVFVWKSKENWLKKGNFSWFCWILRELQRRWGILVAPYATVSTIQEGKSWNTTIIMMRQQRESLSQCHGFENVVNITWIAGMENHGTVAMVLVKRWVEYLCFEHVCPENHSSPTLITLTHSHHCYRMELGWILVIKQGP